MFLEQFLFEFCAKTHTETFTDAHSDSDEYSLVAFCKKATIIGLIFELGLYASLQVIQIIEVIATFKDRTFETLYH